MNTLELFRNEGLTVNSTVEDVRKVFRKISLTYHPDRNQGQNVQVYQEIVSQYEDLLDSRASLYRPEKAFVKPARPTNVYWFSTRATQKPANDMDLVNVVISFSIAATFAFIFITMLRF